MSGVDGVRVLVSIDTEEDNWGMWGKDGATVDNIQHLVELQEYFDKWGARPTYLVNRPPLMDSESVAVLAEIAQHEGVEIGVHCHPWNTPPHTGAGFENSMMCNLPVEVNRAKIKEVLTRIISELGVDPVSFRAGRWGFGPTVSRALAEEGIFIDCSVTPFLDWTSEGGPDYSQAELNPYRFSPDEPLAIDTAGEMIELPTTVGFLHGNHHRLSILRHRLERSPAARLKLVGLVDLSGLMTRRWLSPEQSTLDEMISLTKAVVGSGSTVLQMTLHSCSLLAGATPFVHDEDDRRAFLRRIDDYLRFCSESGYEFATITETAADIRGDEKALRP